MGPLTTIHRLEAVATATRVELPWFGPGRIAANGALRTAFVAEQEQALDRLVAAAAAGNPSGEATDEGGAGDRVEAIGS